MERRSFLKKSLAVSPFGAVALSGSSETAEAEVSNQNELSGRKKVSIPMPQDDSEESRIEIPPPNLSIGVPEHVPDDALVYDASGYELREAPAFSEAIEQLSPDFEPGEYILFMHYEHWQELDRHVAAHSDESSVTSYYDFESHPDEQNFFDFGDFVLNAQGGGYL